MTISVPVREFKSRLSHYLTQAQEGQTIEVTSHRKVIARLTGPDSQHVPEWASKHPGIWKLVASGQATWNGEKPEFGPPVKLSDGGKSLSEMILEDRD